MQITGMPKGEPLASFCARWLAAESLDHELRRRTITATDAAAICGEHPFRSIHDVYASKCGVAETKESVRMALGHLAEPLVMAQLAEARGLTIVKGSTQPHPFLDWVSASTDGDVVSLGRKSAQRYAVAECKLVGPNVVHHWFDEDGAPRMPSHVRIQVQHQMTVRCVRRAFVGVLLNFERFEHFEIESSADLSAEILDTCERFWIDHVKAGKAPKADGSEGARRMLDALFPTNRGPLEVASPDQLAMIHHYDTLRAELKRLEEERDEVSNKLREAIGPLEGFAYGAAKATWKSNAVGSVDWKAVAQALNPSPDLIAEHTGAPPRVLRVHISKAKKAASQAA